MAHKKILITGGTGFIGANLARYFVQRGDEVILLVKPSSNRWRITDIEHDLELMLFNINQHSYIKEIAPDWIFHTAVYGGYSWQQGLNTIMKTNLNGTIRFLNECIETGFESFINTGSSSEYGFKNHPTDEDECVEPNSNYAFSKASATLYCQFKARELNLPISTLRLYSVYGQYEDGKRFIPQIILNGLNKKYPTLSSPDTARDYVHIDDVIKAYELAAQFNSGEIINIGTGEQTTISDVVTLAQDKFRINQMARFNTLENRIWDTNVWVAENKLIKSYGWNPMDFKTGFDKTVKWFKENLQLYNVTS